MKADCPAGCGKRFISADHAKSHADIAHPDWMMQKQRGWATPYGFVDFAKPVTYEEACSFMAREAPRFAEMLSAKERP